MLVRTTIANLSILVVNFATGLMAARFLEAEGRGEYALILLYPQLVSYLTLFGLDRSIPIVVGQNRTAHPLRMVLTTAIGVSVLSVAGTVGAIYLAIEPSPLRQLALAFCAYIPAHQVFTLCVSAHMGRGDFGSYNRSRVIYYYSYLVLILIAIVFGQASVPAFALAYGIATFLGAVASATMFHRRSRELAAATPDSTVAMGSETPSLERPPLIGLKGLAALNLPFVVPAVLYAFAAKLDQMILSLWLDTTMLGIFVVYVSYVGLIGPVANAVNATIFHRSLSEGDDSKDISTMIRLASLVYLGLLLVLGLMASSLVRVFYGPSFATQLGAAYILLVSSFFLFSSQVLNEHLKGKRSTMQDVVSNAAYLCAMAAGAAVLVGPMKLEGLAIAVSIANLARYLTVAVYFKRRAGYALHTFLWPRGRDVILGFNLLLGYLRGLWPARG